MRTYTNFVYARIYIYIYIYIYTYIKIYTKTYVNVHRKVDFAFVYFFHIHESVRCLRNIRIRTYIWIVTNKGPAFLYTWFVWYIYITHHCICIIVICIIHSYNTSFYLYDTSFVWYIFIIHHVHLHLHHNHNVLCRVTLGRNMIHKTSVCTLLRSCVCMYVCQCLYGCIQRVYKWVYRYVFVAYVYFRA